MPSVQIRYFASLREALGPVETAEVPEGSTVGDLRRQLAARGGRHAEVLAAGRPVRAARAQVVCDDETVLHDGDEVAFFPPVTGG
jgi:sulfur-carrier protein